MNDISVKLSAYLDGELDATESHAIEALLETDPDVQAEMDMLLAGNALANEQFDAMLHEPVPLALAQMIKAAPTEGAAQVVARPIWGALAAGLAVFVIGGAGGYLLKAQLTPVAPMVASAGWLSDIADYHAVYAAEKRHLVEVGAEESEHIVTWLGATVGTPFSIPDLSEFGLTFEGGRLLVANAKPVAQLMYRQADGTVIALCLQRGVMGGETSGTPFSKKSIKGFDFVTWSASGADYVIVGPDGQPNLDDIAVAAALNV